MEDKFRYTAFISYSHADASVVKWLHKALEQYRVPVTLVGQKTRAGEVPGKFKPIFRDRDDLSASADLTSSIKEALKQSKFLIVVCSPNSAKSKWVEKEIREFKKLRGQGNILCLIADTDKNLQEPTFPRALWEGQKKGFEPIAADMRAQGDGKRMAKLKLISGILGVELDTLVQRDTKRQQIQLGIAVATFSVATVVLAVLLYLAVEAREEAETNLVLATEARQEAEANRQEAEDLVGFMLGDLRDKLEPIGSLQLLDTISTRALEYYAGIEAGDMTSDRLRRRAQVLLMLGETQELRGNADAALVAFQEAYQTTGELLERDPENTELIYDHAQSTYWLGFTAWRQQDYESAQTYFTDYAAKTEALMAENPEDTSFQAELGYAYSNLGVVQFSQGKFMLAQADFEKAVNLTEAKAEAEPGSHDAQFDLGQTYSWLASSNKELGYYAPALELRQKERQIYARILNENADNRNVWSALASTYRALGNLTYLEGREKGSLSFFDEGLQVMESLIAYDPENTEWREKLVRLYTDKARSYIGERDHKDAERELDKAREQNDRLLSINPDFSNWVLADYRIRVLLAEIRLRTRKRDEGLAMAQSIAGEFYENFPPEERTSELHFLSAEILNLLAEAYDRTGDKDNARENWATVVRILKPFEETGGVTVDTLLPKAEKETGLD